MWGAGSGFIADEKVAREFTGFEDAEGGIDVFGGAGDGLPAIVQAEMRMFQQVADDVLSVIVTYPWS